MTEQQAGLMPSTEAAIGYTWSVVVVMQHPSLASSLLQVLSEYRSHHETFHVQQLNTAEELRWALHELRTLQQIPHLVLFDSFQVAMQNTYLLALQEFPEVTKALLTEKVQAEVLTLAIELCGVDVVMELPFVPRQLLDALKRLQPMWTQDTRRPLRLEAEASLQQLQALESQNRALARANVRTIDVIAELEKKTAGYIEKEAVLSRMAKLLAEECMASDGMLMQGSLTECPLSALLQMLSIAKLSVVVTLLQGGQQASVAMWHGDVLHAAMAATIGVHALEVCLGWQWGEYFVQVATAPSERTIFVPTEELLFERSFANQS